MTIRRKGQAASMTTEEQSKVQEAVAKAIKEIRSRSVSERSSVGRMIKCQDCKMRHRQNQCHMTQAWRAQRLLEHLGNV